MYRLNESFGEQGAMTNSTIRHYYVYEAGRDYLQFNARGNVKKGITYEISHI